MSWIAKGFEQVSAPCCPWPGECGCAPTAQAEVRFRAISRSAPPLSSLDLSASGDHWEVVLADLVTLR